MLHRPELYQAYKEQEKEVQSYGVDEIVWANPQTLEEADELLRNFENIARLIPKSSEVMEEGFTPIIVDPEGYGINIDLLGDENG